MSVDESLIVPLKNPTESEIRQALKMKEFRANSKNLSRLHNLVFCSCRYSESLIFSRDAPERRSKKSDVISELLESKKLTPGIPVVSDQEGAQQQTVIKST